MLEERGSGVFLDASNDSRTFIEYQAGPATLLSSPCELINSCDSQRATRGRHSGYADVTVEETEAQSTGEADIWVMRFVGKKSRSREPILRRYMWCGKRAKPRTQQHSQFVGRWMKRTLLGSLKAQKSWKQGYTEMQGKPKPRVWGGRGRMWSRCQRPWGQVR